jgi:hypothetical protein
MHRHPIRATFVLAAMLLGLAILTAPAAAGGSVDPSTLQPPAPPFAVCRADGPWTICQVDSETPIVNEPVGELPCGTLYETSVDARDGIRWYRDGKLVRRRVSQDAEGTWSLSPVGDGPTVAVATHANWSIDYAIPGDDSSGALTAHGESTVRAPGVGVIVHTAGLDLPDGTHRGVLRVPDDPVVAAMLCAALAA